MLVMYLMWLLLLFTRLLLFGVVVGCVDDAASMVNVAADGGDIDVDIMVDYVGGVFLVYYAVFVVDVAARCVAVILIITGVVDAIAIICCIVGCVVVVVAVAVIVCVAVAVVIHINVVVGRIFCCYILCLLCRWRRDC